ncbi:phage holin family protein [Halobellus captivus]|uniref:phage holin family protein n=1 Tax=Halobellus captivus TaxID=2592614 RepID=UPI0011A678A5|nr:phage holin family protein [Halobellus captivus]
MKGLWDELAKRTNGQRPDNSRIAGISFATVTILIFGVVGLALCNVIERQIASLIVSAILAVATLGYVLLTFGMMSAMKQQTKHTERSLKLQRKPDIVKIVKEEIKPRTTEIRRHKTEFNASNVDAYDHYQIDENTSVERFPELETKFTDPQHAAMISDEVNVNAGVVFLYYQKVKEYCDAHRKAVKELELLLSKDIDNREISSDNIQTYAKSALALEPADDMPSHVWRNKKENVIPIRSNFDEHHSDLRQLKNEIKKLGYELQQEFGRAEAELRQEYQISRSDL